MVIANCVLCFSIGNGPWRPTNYRSCFSIPVGSILELLGSCSKSTVLHHSSVRCTIRQYCSAPFVSTVLHHSSVQLHNSCVVFCTIRQLQFCTIRQFSSAPFVSSVLHHSLATDLHHLPVQFCTSR